MCIRVIWRRCSGNMERLLGWIYRFSKFVSISLITLTKSARADVVAGLNRGKAAIEFSSPSEAEKATKHMDGGQLDGAYLTVQVSCKFRSDQGLAIEMQADLTDIRTSSSRTPTRLPNCRTQTILTFKVPLTCWASTSLTFILPLA